MTTGTPYKGHPLTDLPFVHDEVPKSKTNVRRKFWHVESTGAFSQDLHLGRRLAFEYLRYCAAEKDGWWLLSKIVDDMPRPSTWIEHGFLETVGYAAPFGRHMADQYMASEEAGWRHYPRYGEVVVSCRSDDSVVIEQADGTRGVYRKVGGP